jgi:hypothetical protein
MNLRAFFNSLNTHKVFGVGVGTALASTAAIVARPFVDSFAAQHLGAAAPIATWYMDGVANAAMAALPPAILAAGFGRPPNVPPGPVAP